MGHGERTDSESGDLAELRRIVSALVERCDQLVTASVALKAENEALQDEIRRLKGLPPRPKFKTKPSGMEKSTRPAPVTGRKRVKRRRGSVKAKLEVTREVRLKAKVPAGSRFKGYEDVLVQDLRLSVEVVRYRREIWRTAAGERITAELPAGIMGGFGAEVRRFIAAGHFQGQVTSERLTALLCGMGLEISKRQVVRLLSCGLEGLMAEDRSVLEAGLKSARWISVDDTGAPHAGRNGYVTHLGDRRFAVFRSGFSKSRRAFLGLLQAGHREYVVNDAALARMRGMNMAAAQIDALASHGDKHFTSAAAWEAHLAALGFDQLTVTPTGAYHGPDPRCPLGPRVCHIIEYGTGSGNAMPLWVCQKRLMVWL